MPVSINTNPASATAARALEIANKNLTDSLKRLSTGSRIANTYDDAAGEAVQLKLKNQSKQYDVLKSNLQNGISFLDVQQGVLETATSTVSRLGELQAMATDSTKSSDDKALYQAEVTQLTGIMTQLAAQEFNGNGLFGGSDTINTNLNSTPGTMNIGDEDFASAFTAGDYSDITTVTAATVEADIQAIASLKATVGGKQSALNYYYDNAVTTQNNINAARSRITDVDIAIESGTFARNQVLAQAASAMLAQANSIGASTAMQLLM